MLTIREPVALPRLKNLDESDTSYRAAWLEVASLQRIAHLFHEKLEVAALEGTHELSVHYSYWDKQKKKRRTGFAIGASSPKMIIVRPKR